MPIEDFPESYEARPKKIDLDYAVDDVELAKKNWEGAKEAFLRFQIEMENERDRELADFRDSNPNMAAEELEAGFKKIWNKYNRIIDESKENRDLNFARGFYWKKKGEAEKKLAQKRAEKEELERQKAESAELDQEKLREYEKKLAELRVEELEVKEPKVGEAEGPYQELVMVESGGQYFLNKKHGEIKSSTASIYDYLTGKGLKVDQILIAEENGTPMRAVWDAKKESYFYQEPGKRVKRPKEVKFGDGVMYTLTLMGKGKWHELYEM